MIFRSSYQLKYIKGEWEGESVISSRKAKHHGVKFKDTLSRQELISILCTPWKQKKENDKWSVDDFDYLLQIISNVSKVPLKWTDLIGANEELVKPCNNKLLCNFRSIDHKIARWQRTSKEQFRFGVSSLSSASWQMHTICNYYHV